MAGSLENRGKLRELIDKFQTVDPVLYPPITVNIIFKEKTGKYEKKKRTQH